MNTALSRLADAVGLLEPGRERLRLEFGLACVARVEHLLEEPRAPVGRALDAASYAAYASVYAYGGYAVNDPSSFEPEYAWQAEQLRQLAARRGIGSDARQASAT